MTQSFQFLRLLLAAKLILIFLVTGGNLSAQENKTNQENEVPVLRDLNSYFPFAVPKDLDAWEARKAQLQKHLRVSLGLWPYPGRPPLKAVIHGVIDQGDYTVEKVYFESLPGFYVTGNLYKPKKIDGRVPGIVSPHGHFPQGRFGCQSDEAIEKDLKSGAESFRANAKNKIQSRCANLAKMGCVVFVYDMIGYADNQQISYQVAHRFSRQQASSSVRWGLFSPQAELRLQNVMGLQAWNSIRAIDFVESLPDVDPKRIGVTGASGGGTQTFIVCALDDRPAAAFPAVMVSTAMQGGCTCENCSYLRVGTGNVEIAAMFAPKPLGLTAANDWTKEMETKGFPELQKLYELYGKPENVQLTAKLEFGHNYNQVSREAMYRWFKKHLNFAGEPVETEIEYLKPEIITVYNEQHPRPRGGDHFERNMLVGLDAAGLPRGSVVRERTINRLLDDPAIRKEFAKIHETNDRAALTRILSRDLGNISDDLKIKLKSQTNIEGYEHHQGTFIETVMNAARQTNGDPQDLKVRKFSSVETRWDFVTDNIAAESSVQEFFAGESRVVFVGNEGLSVLAKDNVHKPFFDKLVDSKIGVSVFENGWMKDADKKQTRRVNNPREALAYTVGYNAPQLARRADAWLLATTLTTVSDSPKKNSVFVVSLDQAGLEVALNARELKSRPEVAGMVINTHGFRFNGITNIRDPNLLPGAIKYGDLPGLLTLAAPKPLLLIGEDKRSALGVIKAYEAHGASENLTVIKSIPAGKTEHDVVIEWIQSQQKKNKNQ